MLTANPAMMRRASPVLWAVIILLVTAVLVVSGKLVVKAGPWALLVPLIVPLTWAALTRPMFAVYALAFTSPLTSGMARGAIIPFFRTNELAFLVLLYVAAVTFLARKRTWRITWADKLILIYLAVRVALPTVVFLFRGEPWGAFAFKTLFGPLQYYLIFRMAVECVEESRQVRRLIFWLMISSGIVSLVGVMQALQIPGINAFLETAYPSDKDIYTFVFAARVTSLWAGDWNGLGLFMAMTTVLGLGTVHLYAGRWQRLTLITLSCLNLVVVFLTASFTGAICLFVGLALLFMFHPEARRLVKPLLIAAPIIGLVLARIFWEIVSERLEIQFDQTATTLIPHSFRIRMFMWRELMWPWVERFWLFGLGPYRYGWPVEESYYMFLILKSGVMGVLGFTVLNVGLLVRLRRMFRPLSGWEGAVALVVFVHLVQTLLANITGSHFEANGVAEIMWLFLGTLMAAEVRGGRLRGLTGTGR